MTIASIHQFSSKKSLTAKDYIQDGLVIQLDGIENGGYGKHVTEKPFVELISGNPQVSANKDRYELLDDIISVNANISLDDKNLIRNTFNSGNFTVEAYGSANQSTDLFSPLYANPNVAFQVIWSNTYLNAYVQGIRYVDYRVPVPMSPLHAHVSTSVANTTARVYAKGDLAYKIDFLGWRTSASSYYILQCNYNSLRLYNRALSEDEVMHNLAVDEARFRA